MRRVAVAARALLSSPSQVSGVFVGIRGGADAVEEGDRADLRVRTGAGAASGISADAYR